MRNYILIIKNYSINAATDTIDVICQLPSLNAMGLAVETKTVSFKESELLPSPNWSNDDLKQAIAQVTHVPIDNILYFTELTDDEKEKLNKMSKINNYMVRTFI